MKEEITDLLSDKGIRELKVGSVLKFRKLDGGLTVIKITKKDTKAMRVWGEHINLYDPKMLEPHESHDVDYDHPEGIYCRTCKRSLRTTGKSTLVQALDKERK